MRARAAGMVVSIAMAGCGGDGTGPSSGALRLETGNAVTARIGSAGGTLQTTDASGRVYLLDIPGQAIRDSQNVTMTPVSGLDLPSGTSLVTAAHFAPEGLQLAVPARLRIVAPGAAAGIAGFGYSGDADSLHLDFLGRNGDTLFVPVRHFSGAGAAATPDVALLSPSLPSGAPVQAFIAVEQLTYQGQSTGSYDVQALASAMRQWADEVVIPGLQSAGTDQALLDAAARYADWVMVLNCGGPTCPAGALHLWPEAVRLDIATSLLVTYDGLRLELAKALKAGIDRLNARCVSAHDIQAAANAVFWLGTAVIDGLDALVPGLDLASFEANFCLAVEIESVTMPSTLTAGSPAQLQVKAGLSFGGSAPDYTQPLTVIVSAGNAGNATPASATGVTTNGVYTTSLTPGGTSPIFLGIRAQLAPGRPDALADIRRDTTYEQPYGHVTITPTAAILDPGAQAQFTATVTGLAGSAVTWSATGGTRASTGNSTIYTAGSTPGTYDVTATSVSDPTQKATARIEIVSRVTGGVTMAPPNLAVVVRSGVYATGAGESCDNSVPNVGAGVLSATGNCASDIASAHASSMGTFTYSLTKDASGKVTQMHFNGQGTANAASTEITSGAGGLGSSRFLGTFDVVAPSADYRVTGTLTAIGPIHGGQSDFHISNIQTGALIHCATTSSQVGNCPLITALGFSGTLTPGQYEIYIQTRADADTDGSGVQTPAAASSADVTITFDQR
jgi:hypothetical protein